MSEIRVNDEGIFFVGDALNHWINIASDLKKTEKELNEKIEFLHKNYQVDIAERDNKIEKLYKRLEELENDSSRQISQRDAIIISLKKELSAIKRKD